MHSKLSRLSLCSCCEGGALILAAGLWTVPGQGTVAFDAHPYFNGTNYSELGITFSVIVPQASAYDYMGIVPGSLYLNLPRNSTPFMIWFQQYNPYDYVAFSLANGSSFGLTSVQLADPNSPSLSAVPISFVGVLAGGSTVTNTFVTPGNNANSFLTYPFTSAFSSGLVSVDIFATRWAMDNLVFTVPEPDTMSLLVIGLLAFAARKIKSQS